jgi:hypothetical protein
LGRGRKRQREVGLIYIELFINPKFNMKYYLLVVFIILFSDIYSQKHLDVILLLKDSNDCLEEKMIVPMYRYDTNTINEPSFLNTVKIVNNDKKDFLNEDWIKAKNINFLKFTDYSGKIRVFVTRNYDKRIKIIDSVNYQLYEILFDGKISWYRTFSNHPVDQSKSYVDFFVKQGKRKATIVNIFTTYQRKLLKLTMERPDLIPEIEKCKSEQDIIEILEQYNEKPSSIQADCPTRNK